MKGYGQFCPIAKASEVLGERWTNLVIRELGAGSESFNDIRKGLPLISPSLLSSRLKSLETSGVVDRTEHKGSVRYTLSKSGEELVTIIRQLGTWGQRWVRSDLSQEELDPSLLVWDIHRNLNVDFFKENRNVINLEFTDYTSKFRHWWLVIKDGDVDVCMKNPGYDVDLIISSDLKTFTAVWMGDTTIMAAMRAKKVEVTGNVHLRKNISIWMGSNYYADVKPAKR